ncbi:MAG: peptide deformylase [Bacteroidales bacterium]|nr:peptide deformylase [Bacteroidales bacterium]HOK98456.1 peptide deformylase [Bacteroidales bacterium]HPO64850.1 peptide deformylase [Bacteroidales bacterium]
MIYPIYVYGQPVLRQVAKEISFDYPNLKTLIADMFETMKVSDGIGLAAPQIGLSIRLFVVDATSMAEEEPALKDFRKVFINPKILERWGEETIFNEGCLSLPGIREDVKRESIIRIAYYDEDFKPHEEVYDGFAARVIQHEYDHIEGILFIDRISPLRRKMLKSKLLNISKGLVEANYKIKALK